MFRKKQETPPRPKPCSHHIESAGGKRFIVIDCAGCPANASLANPVCRNNVMDMLSGDNTVDGFVMKKDFSKIFGRDCVEALLGLHDAIEKALGTGLCERCAISMSHIRENPMLAYYALSGSRCHECGKKIKTIVTGLERSGMIRSAARSGSQYIAEVSASLLPGIISPFIATEPPAGRPEAKYCVRDSEASIYHLPERLDMQYFVKMPEFNLSVEELSLLGRGFDELCAHKVPENMEPECIKKEFEKAISGIIERLCGGTDMDKDKLKKILARHTVGYGAIESILADENVQDIFIDSSHSAVHAVHGKFGECITNIILSKNDVEKLETRLRTVSGRPLDASSPVLHAELEEFGVRVCGICEPSTYRGTGIVFRRRKSTPWTLSEFISAGMIDARTAGLLSFLIDGQNSILITGPRSSGKTSLLTALLLEIPQNRRIIIIEDTPEIPVDALKKLGFKIEHLKTEAFAKGFEMSTEDALRTSLRLGESVLVIGEVRGPEAKALFEAMRIGASGNVVLGTIHGSGPHDTWDRVVNDLGVPATSFKAVDVVVSAGTIRFGEDVKRHRRLLSVSEVKSGWIKEPEFSELVSYVRSGDKWKSGIGRSEKLIKAAEMKGMGRKRIMGIVEAKARMKSDLLAAAKKTGRSELSGPEWSVVSNNHYFKLASANDNPEKVYRMWSTWLKNSAGLK
jgi:type IV secretory pathway ATPase VirB11/archaellum biosynthesis ATPase